MRYDQFMHLGWKVLIPINLVWILSVATVRVLDDRNWSRVTATLVVVVPVLIVLAIVGLALDRSDKVKAFELNQTEAVEAQRKPTFPVPPMDLVVPTAPRLLRSSTASTTGSSRRSAVSAGAPERNSS
jgi:NADH-quinone oxidoreductase subunit H